MQLHHLLATSLTSLSIVSAIAVSQYFDASTQSCVPPFAHVAIVVGGPSVDLPGTHCLLNDEDVDIELHVCSGPDLTGACRTVDLAPGADFGSAEAIGSIEWWA
jgi:hypothetical protein